MPSLSPLPNSYGHSFSHPQLSLSPTVYYPTITTGTIVHPPHCTAESLLFRDLHPFHAMHVLFIATYNYPLMIPLLLTYLTQRLLPYQRVPAFIRSAYTPSHPHPILLLMAPSQLINATRHMSVQMCSKFHLQLSFLD